MIRNTLVVTVLPLLLLAAGGAVAEDERGFAVNFGVGVSKVKDTDGSEKFDGSAFGYSIGAEYRFGTNFALGSGIFGLGNPDDDFNGTNTKIAVKGADLKMRFIMPISDGAEFFGQVGSAWYTADLEPGGNNGFGETAVEFGVGLDLGAGDLAFRVLGIYLDGPNDESGALITAGFNYRF